jgi:hypothetical protein
MVWRTTPRSVPDHQNDALMPMVALVGYVASPDGNDIAVVEPGCDACDLQPILRLQLGDEIDRVCCVGRGRTG